eukprot:TRINITY_DN3406_c1_g2_i4.p1 TRINITY_DN3406_c1_g2~~TRINITY_DN3406_c1_g2_i4.p1  ORF type:complete len:480 (-),score=67.82 TRINITY_DN3406_c1_g2_i4:82-1521(-)
MRASFVTKQGQRCLACPVLALTCLLLLSSVQAAPLPTSEATGDVNVPQHESSAAASQVPAKVAGASLLRAADLGVEVCAGCRCDLTVAVVELGRAHHHVARGGTELLLRAGCRVLTYVHEGGAADSIWSLDEHWGSAQELFTLLEHAQEAAQPPWDILLLGTAFRSHVHQSAVQRLVALCKSPIALAIHRTTPDAPFLLWATDTPTETGESSRTREIELWSGLANDYPHVLGMAWTNPSGRMCTHLRKEAAQRVERAGQQLTFLCQSPYGLLDHAAHRTPPAGRRGVVVPGRETGRDYRTVEELLLTGAVHERIALVGSRLPRKGQTPNGELFPEVERFEGVDDSKFEDVIGEARFVMPMLRRTVYQSFGILSSSLLNAISLHVPVLVPRRDYSYVQGFLPPEYVFVYDSLEEAGAMVHMSNDEYLEHTAALGDVAHRFVCNASTSLLGQIHAALSAFSPPARTSSSPVFPSNDDAVIE